MEVSTAKIASDEDFNKLKTMMDSNDGWRQDYDKNSTKVWSKFTQQTDFKMIKVHAFYKNVKPSVLYDVLFDPDFRKTWDTYMIEGYDIGYLDTNNDIGYYAVQSPTPLKNRDFVLQRSWRHTENEYCIMNHSVFLENYPPKQGYVRAVSFLTGFLVRPAPCGCQMGYVSQCDPKGSLPPWLVNRFSQIFAPKVAKNLYMACLKYEDWKSRNNPDQKPWLNPEQVSLPRMQLSQLLAKDIHKSNDSLDECNTDERNLKEEDFASS